MKLGCEGKGVKGAVIPELLRPALIQSPAGRQAHSNVTNHAGAIPGSLLPDQDQERMFLRTMMVRSAQLCLGLSREISDAQDENEARRLRFQNPLRTPPSSILITIARKPFATGQRFFAP